MDAHNRPFRVQVAVARDQANRWGHNRVPPSSSSGEAVEIITLYIVSTLDELLKDAYAAYMALNTRQSKQALEKANPENKTELVGIIIEWEHDSSTRGRFTEVQNGNVRNVLERLRARETCDDVVWLLSEAEKAEPDFLDRFMKAEAHDLINDR